MEPVVLDGRTLTRAGAVRAARGEGGAYPEVRLDAAARAHLADLRLRVERVWLRPGAPPVYGFHTGVGGLKDRLVPPEEAGAFQIEYLRAHAVGVGPLLSAGERDTSSRPWGVLPIPSKSLPIPTWSIPATATA